METVEKYVVGWGDNTGGRQAYTIDDINNGALGTAIVFNSISDGAIGHEFNFVGARTSDGKDLWSGNVIEAVEGEIYRVRIYAHNNNPGAYLALAKDVSVRFNLAKPVRVTGNDIALDGFNSGNGYYAAAVHGFISVSNGTPSEYWDGVKFVSNRPFHLEYITGTATYENSGIGAGGYRLSDNVVKDYVKIGYDEMNGEIPGCFGYASYTTILVKPVFDD